MHLPAATSYERGRRIERRLRRLVVFVRGYGRFEPFFGVLTIASDGDSRIARAASTSVEHEREQRVARGDQDVLPAVDAVGDRGVRDLADARMPERLPGPRVVRHDVAAGVAREHQSAGGREDTATAAVAGRVGMAPDDLAVAIVDRRQVAPG